MRNCFSSCCNAIMFFIVNYGEKSDKKLCLCTSLICKRTVFRRLNKNLNIIQKNILWISCLKLFTKMFKFKTELFKKHLLGPGICSSVEKCLSSKQEVLGLIPSTAKTESHKYAILLALFKKIFFKSLCSSQNTEEH